MSSSNKTTVLNELQSHDKHSHWKQNSQHQYRRLFFANLVGSPAHPHSTGRDGIECCGNKLYFWFSCRNFQMVWRSICSQRKDLWDTFEFHKHPFHRPNLIIICSEKVFHFAVKNFYPVSQMIKLHDSIVSERHSIRNQESCIFAFRFIFEPSDSCMSMGRKSSAFRSGIISSSVCPLLFRSPGSLKYTTLFFLTPAMYVRLLSSRYLIKSGLEPYQASAATLSSR